MIYTYDYGTKSVIYTHGYGTKCVIYTHDYGTKCVIYIYDYKRNARLIRLQLELRYAYYFANEDGVKSLINIS